MKLAATLIPIVALLYNRGIDDEVRNDFNLAIVDFISYMEALLSTGSYMESQLS